MLSRRRWNKESIRINTRRTTLRRVLLHDRPPVFIHPRKSISVLMVLNVYFAALKAATKGSPWMGPSFTWMDQRLCLWNPPGPSRALDPDLPKFVPARRSSAGDAFRPRGEEIGQRLTVTHPIFRASIGRTEDCEPREQSHAFGAGDTAASGSGSRAREGPGPSK